MMKHPAWLENAVFYEIYPQSFYDTNGDGIGDLEGIIRKLDYIQELNVNALWLNPCFESSFRDAGYDITNFYRIAPRYGTNEDICRLCKEVHKRGMHIVLDLVAGHTSIDHPRFQASCRKELESDDYIWTDGWILPSKTPKNFISGCSKRDGFYLTNFFYAQPALDYGFSPADPKCPWQRPVTHPAVQHVRQELKNIMAFWLDLGCDGFRADMASSLVRGDNAKQAIHELWNEYRTWLENEYPEAVLISEWGKPAEAISAGFHVDFMFQCGQKGYTALLRGEPESISNSSFADQLSQSFFSTVPGGNPMFFLNDLAENLQYAEKYHGYIGIPTGNHDMGRLRFGSRTPEQIKAIYAFLFFLPALPFLYYGDEIGMRSIPGLGNVEGSYCRSAARTPMQWNASDNAGFSTAPAEKLYLPIDPANDRPTVQQQEMDKNSLLNHTRMLLKFRQTHSAAKPEAEYRLVFAKENSSPVIYQRIADTGEQLLVAVNPVDSPARAVCPIPGISEFQLLTGTPGAVLENLDGAAQVILPPQGYSVWFKQA